MKLKYIDKTHAYYLDGKRCRSVTGIAGLPDDKYGLEQWKQRQVAIGLAMKPHLVESVAAHHDNKAKVNDLCALAMTAAGSSQEAEFGTAAHRVTERLDAGEDIIPTPLSAIIADAWPKVLAKAKLRVVRDFIEALIVYPQQKLCGRLDRFVDDGEGLAVADLKTGESVVNYPHSVATQMALYANAPLLARLPNKGDSETETFEQLPANLRKDVGYMIHMPRAGEAAVYAVDLIKGWDCVENIIFPSLGWRAVAPTKLLKRVA